MINILIVLLCGVLFAALNRIRGGALENGALIATLSILALLLTFLPFRIELIAAVSIAWIMAIIYNLQERHGWGDWDTLAYNRNATMPQPYKEGSKNGIQWIASKIIDPSKDWNNHCRVALFIRGLYLWICLFPFAYFIAWYYVALAILLSALAFPLACEIAYRTSKLWSFKYMTGGWEHQEVFNGFLVGLVIGTLFTL